MTERWIRSAVNTDKIQCISRTLLTVTTYNFPNPTLQKCNCKPRNAYNLLSGPLLYCFGLNSLYLPHKMNFKGSYNNIDISWNKPKRKMGKPKNMPTIITATISPWSQWLRFLKAKVSGVVNGRFNGDLNIEAHGNQYLKIGKCSTLLLPPLLNIIIIVIFITIIIILMLIIMKLRPN